MTRHVVDPEFYVAMGWLERLCYWSYAVPQLVKNRKTTSALAISPWFLSIAISTSVLDTIAAWSYHWPAPSLYGGMVALVFKVILLRQYFRSS